MSFNFFTLGGKHSWEDLLIYQHWRIQRHYLFKDYRLLDKFDIEREAGSFNDCYKSLLEYIKAYEMDKQKDNIVILIHGLRESKEVFNNMIEKMNSEGYLAMAINYPSTKKGIDSHVRQFNVLMSNLLESSNVSFIAKGTGGIILRKLLSSKYDWKNRIKVKKVIQISPPNKGSRLFSKLSEYSIFRWILGPMISETNTKNIKRVPSFPKGTELGIIHCDYPFKSLLTKFPKSFKNHLPSQVEGDIDSPNKSLYISNTKSNPMDNDRVVNACIRFLKDGMF